MGGHVAEKLIIGSQKISSGCGSDLQGATSYAVQAVRHSGMFGDLASYVSSNFEESSDDYNAKVDRAVKIILDVSHLSFKSSLILTLTFCRNHLRELRTCY